MCYYPVGKEYEFIFYIFSRPEAITEMNTFQVLIPFVCISREIYISLVFHWTYRGFRTNKF